MSFNQLTFSDIKKNVLVKDKDLLSKKSAGFLLVYRDGCMHCEKFKPEFVKLYNLIQNANGTKKLGIYAMDSSDKDNASFMKKHRVEGVPTLFFISNSGVVSPYHESRSAEKIYKDLINSL